MLTDLGYAFNFNKPGSSTVTSIDMACELLHSAFIKESVLFLNSDVDYESFAQIESFLRYYGIHISRFRPPNLFKIKFDDPKREMLHKLKYPITS